LSKTLREAGSELCGPGDETFMHREQLVKRLEVKSISDVFRQKEAHVAL
jgi:hypothetical protein